MADLRDQRLPGPVVNLPPSPAAWWTADGPPWHMTADSVTVVGPLP